MSLWGIECRLMKINYFDNNNWAKKKVFEYLLNAMLHTTMNSCRETCLYSTHTNKCKVKTDIRFFETHISYATEPHWASKLHWTSCQETGSHRKCMWCEYRQNPALAEVLHAFSITAQQAKWSPDPDTYNIFNGSLEADFPSPCAGITNACTEHRKTTLRLSFRVLQRKILGYSMTKVQ